MPLQLEITSDHKDILGDDHMRLFRESGGTIGRALENDWILPDPDKFISGRHATVDYQSGAYYLADVSTNGVYVNDEEEPLGKGKPRRLFDGDRLRMGDFEFIVHVDEGEDLDMPAALPQGAVPVAVGQQVPELTLRTGMQLLDEEEITGDEEFHDALFGAPVNGKQSRRHDPMVSQQVNPFQPPPDPGPLTVDDLLAAFLEGAGIERSELHPATDPVEIMHNAGKVLQEFVNGITDLLASRSSMKSMFRLDQTTVLPRHNNPLKLSANKKDSIKQMLVGREGEYLGPLDSVKEVCRDLKFHQDAMLEGMTEAFLEFSDRFDPDELQQNFDRTLSRKPLFHFLNQIKYWTLYCDLYPIMTQPGSGKFPQHFGEDFVRAYEKHIAEYKRLDRIDADE
jgi:predicted component of type VI protein secretion system